LWGVRDMSRGCARKLRSDGLMDGLGSLVNN
jgi:hypothetical protein